MTLFRTGFIGAVVSWDALLIVVLLGLRQSFAQKDNLRINENLRIRAGVLHSSEARFKSLVQNSSDSIVVIDRDYTITYASPSANQVLRTLQSELINAPLTELVHPQDRKELTDRLGHLRDSTDSGALLQFRSKARAGEWRDLEATPTNLLDDPDVAGIVLNMRDISERTRLEDQLRHQAFHDPLTQLANRALLSDRVQHALGRARREGGQIALLFIDLDDFKKVNDTMGHGTGDRLLTIVAQRIESALRETDTAARLGGDEFAVLLEGDVSASWARIIAERIIATVSEVANVDDMPLAVGASVGIALGNGATETDNLMRQADVAMYRAKADGKGDVAIFDDSMDLMVTAALQFEVEMREALTSEQVVAFYQPIVDTDTGIVRGAEALARWAHPTRGLLPPSEFIGLAEETGQIVAIGKEILRVACAEAKTWQAARPGTYVSVNVSSRHFQNQTLVADVAAVLKDSGLDGQCLVIEVTETALLSNVTESAQQMNRLKRLGVRIALDDFGTGYSSLGYLRELPVDILKIDRSFVINLASGVQEAEFVRAIKALSRSLSLSTIAEGVEDFEQLHVLRSLGVEYAQGYLMSRPVPSDAIAGLICKPLLAPGQRVAPQREDVTAAAS